MPALPEPFPRLRPLVAAVAVAVAVALVAVVAPALAAKRNGITPLAPKAGSTVTQGSAPTFRMKVSGKGSVWVYVCKSRKRNAKGVICRDEMIERARRGKRGRASVKPRVYDYPGFWLNTPGTYYWQAHRIRCEGGTSDCLQEGPVVKFRVG